jgi:hypothetical protein
MNTHSPYAQRSLSEFISHVKVRDDYSYGLKNFLDEFRSNPRIELLQEEPQLLDPILQDDGLADAYVASAAAYLCQLHGFPQPDWVNAKQRIKKIPWFAAKTPNLKAILIQESPAAFRVRNLFVSANALHRA